VRTIEVPDEVADALEARAVRSGLPLAEVLRIFASADDSDSIVRSHLDVMGGDDCIRGTRIPVWLLVSARQQGLTDGEILESYPQLSALDLSAAWDHFAHYPERVLGQRDRHAEDA
jgi:uncharacterized protein (DUF433 family)